MKKLAIALLCYAISLSTFAMTDKAKNELTKALQGDYQTLRNVAYSMSNGIRGHDKNPIMACALRKIILIVNSDETDAGDYSNEYVDCKALPLIDSEKAWKITLQLLPMIVSD
ncbi:hypothetical protein [Avibacterium paragallinarum]|uniref:Uncharacterized protein n=1 Tax=Avibacterium paragallinarum TaxID=728 RepID=A0ABU7QLQ1_AVIPA|nr:hypothetical protein [Avibacterium paragallinarum]QZP15566.1 hypothetical protein K5O18_12555 [Avibacterium paragallinarum]QZP16157.1 hypothetical protein K5O18_01980 [Avibacterium paragallinarum]WAL56790.1 hypothetical protein OY678_12930 [Avibacterium paragallinarum]WAM59335.1 hypothetical protein OW731_12740 [Avibacterium paragallinarum]